MLQYRQTPEETPLAAVRAAVSPTKQDYPYIIRKMILIQYRLRDFYRKRLLKKEY
jgi:hypothetical protein